MHLLERMRSLTATIQKSCSSLVRIVTKIPQNEFLAKKVRQIILGYVLFYCRGKEATIVSAILL